jgi:WD repeat-containing protein 60
VQQEAGKAEDAEAEERRRRRERQRQKDIDAGLDPDQEERRRRREKDKLRVQQETGKAEDAEAEERRLRKEQKRREKEKEAELIAARALEEEQHRLAAQKAAAEAEEQQEEEEQDYEEDFEDYEEDFEEEEEEEEEAEQAEQAESQEKNASRSVVPAIVGVNTVHDQEGGQSDLDLIRRAISEENAQAMKEKEYRAGTTPRPSSRTSADEAAKENNSNSNSISIGNSSHSEKVLNRPPKPGGRKIVAKKKLSAAESAVVERLTRRAKDLWGVIDLEMSAEMQVFNQSPLTEYELYMRHFGTSNSVQIACQHGDDLVGVSVSTDTIDVVSRRTQWPEDIAVGRVAAPEIDAWNGRARWEDGEGEAESDFSPLKQSLPLTAATVSAGRNDTLGSISDPLSFTRFIRGAGHWLDSVLAASSNGGVLSPKRGQTESMEHANPTIASLPSEMGRQRVITDISPAMGANTPSLSLIAYSSLSHSAEAAVQPSTKVPLFLQRGSLLVLWSMQAPPTIQKILRCEGEASSVVLTGDGASLACCGTQEGSLRLWDLRDLPQSRCETVSWTDSLQRVQEAICVDPTFVTEPLGVKGNHACPIVSLQVIHRNRSYQRDGEITSQLVSLDMAGCCAFWTVVELPFVDGSGSLQDLGLAPGGRLKLAQTSSLGVFDSIYPSLAIQPSAATQMALSIADPSLLLIGCNIDAVVKLGRYGNEPPPKILTAQAYDQCHAAAKGLDAICSVAFSPYLPNVVAVGTVLGQIRLYDIHESYPLVEFQPFARSNMQALVSLMWSPTRPAMIATVDVHGNINLIDVRKSDMLAEQGSEPITDSSSRNVIVSRMRSVACEKDPAHVTVQRATLTDEGRGWEVCFLLGLSNGDLEILPSTDVFRQVEDNELEETRQVISNRCL